MRDLTIEAGAPENVISAVTVPTIGATNELMKCKEVAIIIATGGQEWLRLLTTQEHQLWGVGAGNSPRTYIERTANDVELSC